MRWLHERSWWRGQCSSKAAEKGAAKQHQMKTVYDSLRSSIFVHSCDNSCGSCDNLVDVLQVDLQTAWFMMHHVHHDASCAGFMRYHALHALRPTREMPRPSWERSGYGERPQGPQGPYAEAELIPRQKNTVRRSDWSGNRSTNWSTVFHFRKLLPPEWIFAKDGEAISAKMKCTTPKVRPMEESHALLCFALICFTIFDLVEQSV